MVMSFVLLWLLSTGNTIRLERIIKDSLQQPLSAQSSEPYTVPTANEQWVPPRTDNSIKVDPLGSEVSEVPTGVHYAVDYLACFFIVLSFPMSRTGFTLSKPILFTGGFIGGGLLAFCFTSTSHYVLSTTLSSILLGSLTIFVGIIAFLFIGAVTGFLSVCFLLNFILMFPKHWTPNFESSGLHFTVLTIVIISGLLFVCFTRFSKPVTAILGGNMFLSSFIYILHRLQVVKTIPVYTLFCFIKELFSSLEQVQYYECSAGLGGSLSLFLIWTIWIYVAFKLQVTLEIKESENLKD